MAKAISPTTFAAGQDGAAWLQSYSGMVYLRRHYVNRQGYDAGGTYWGVGENLYYIIAEGEVHNEEGHFWYHEDFFRAQDRKEAVAIARDLFPVGKIQP